MRIVYFDIDSLRPDHLGCYGYHRATSPVIDGLAADATRFTNCTVTDAPCLPSRSALWSGRCGFHTGVVGHGGTAGEPMIEGPGRGFRDRFGNTGWMSEVQSAAKPHLIPLIEGRQCTIEGHPQRLISLWAAMAIMVGEFQEPEKVAISAEHRSHLRLNRGTPPNWRIWIGRYKRGEWKSHWFHCALPVSTKEYVPDMMDSGIRRPNTQTTTFVAGQLFIHAMSSDVPNLVDRFRFIGSGASKLRQIWPVVDAQIDWPPVILTDNEAHNLSNAFFNFALRTAEYQSA